MTSESMKEKLKIPHLVSGLSHLANLYDLYLIDLWGVIHDGEAVFSDVNECLHALSNQDRTIVFLSNSPKRSQVIHELLHNIGLSKSLKYEIITSGEYAYNAISALYSAEQNRLETCAFFWGPPQHENLKDTLPLKFSHNIEECNLIINTGFFRESDHVDDYKNMFAYAKTNKLPLYCLNPDFFAIDRHRKIPCAGLIAKEYQGLGGDVIYYGKPYNLIYKFVHKKFPAPKRRILAIGDSLYSDIQGAKNFGISSLLILSGIHANRINFSILDSPKLVTDARSFFEQENIYPDYIMSHFKWS